MEARCKVAIIDKSFMHKSLPSWIVLTFVGTHPDYQGRGAGTLLTEWGLAKAKSENIPVYLDSTIPASRIYLKLGFVPVDGLSMSLPGMGRDGEPYIYEELSMLRTWDADS